MQGPFIHHFEPNAILALIQSAYGEVPQADAMGAWVPLRGELALPTIDCGSGTWESHFPGSGIQDNLADKAKKLGIPLWKFGGA